MSFEWKRYSLSELASFKYGKFLAKSKLTNTGYPVFSGYGIVGYLPNYQFENPALIMVCRGEGGTGDVKMSPPKCSITNLSIIISPDEKKVSRNFLYWALKAKNTRLLRTGSAQSQIVISSLENYDISIPIDKAIQTSIAGFLDRLEARITLLRETNKTLECIAQTIFKSWFVDFDPVRAKMEGRQPEGMDEETAALFPDEFEESELGLIPKWWSIGCIADLGEVICGKTPATSEKANYGSDVPFLTIPDMHSRLVVNKTSRYLSKIGADTQRKKYLRAGSVAVSCIATPGLVVQVTALSQTNQQINSVVPYEKWGDRFSLFLLQKIGEQVKIAGSGGSVFHNLSKSGFEKIKVFLPDESIARSFDSLVYPIVKKISNNENTIDALTSIRDCLLPRLVSGKIRLPNAQSLKDTAGIDQ